MPDIGGSIAAISTAVKLEIAFASEPFAVTPTWVDVTGDAMSISMRRGRSGGAGGTFDGGSLTVTVNNDDGDWDRSNPGSAYGSNLKRDRLIRLSGSDDGFTTSRVLFVGFLDNVVPQSTAHHSTATITASDLVRILSDIDLEDVARPFEATGVRVAALLTSAGIPAAWQGTIDNGVVWCAADTVSIDTTQALQELARTEYGLFYVSNDGLVQWRNRYAVLDVTAWSTSQVNLNDTGADTLGYAPITSDQGGFNEVRRVTASGYSGNKFAFDATPANNPSTTKAVTNTGAFFDADSIVAAEAWQKGWEFTGQRPRKVRMTTVLPSVALSSLTEIVDGTVELFNRATLSYQPTGWGSAYTFHARIEEIEHEIVADEWQTTLTLSPHQTTWQTESVDWFEAGAAVAVTDVPAL